jgi:alkylation response protein AidB-like acyl-CoA dehydrogenase
MQMLTPGQEQLRQDAKAFVADNIIPHARAFDKSGEFHDYLLEAAKPSRIFAMAVPKQYGGLGYGALPQALVLEEWGYGCCAMATTLAASILSMEAVLIAGNEDQRRRFFAPMLNGEIGAFGLTEPGAGSDVGAGSTTAVKSGGDYILNGAKCWITNASFASVHVVFAQTDKAAGAKGLSAFIVEKGTPGLHFGDVEHKLGLRSSNTVFYALKDARLPAANLLGREGDGMKIAMKTLDTARPAIGALAVGLAQRALDECVAYLHRRFPGKPYPGQSLQFQMADMQIAVQAARQTLHDVMRLRDANLPFSKESAIAKTFCTDTAMRVSAQAVRLAGSHGYTSELSKFMRDAKVMQIYEGTNQIQRLVIARAVLAAAPATAPVPAAVEPKVAAMKAGE